MYTKSEKSPFWFSELSSDMGCIAIENYPDVLGKNEMVVNENQIPGFELKCICLTWFLMRYDDSIEKRVQYGMYTDGGSYIPGLIHVSKDHRLSYSPFPIGISKNGNLHNDISRLSLHQ